MNTMLIMVILLAIGLVITMVIAILALVYSMQGSDSNLQKQVDKLNSHIYIDDTTDKVGLISKNGNRLLLESIAGIGGGLFPAISTDNTNINNRKFTLYGQHVPGNATANMNTRIVDGSGATSIFTGSLGMNPIQSAQIR